MVENRSLPGGKTLDVFDEDEQCNSTMSLFPPDREVPPDVLDGAQVNVIGNVLLFAVGWIVSLVIPEARLRSVSPLLKLFGTGWRRGAAGLTAHWPHSHAHASVVSNK